MTTLLKHAMAFVAIIFAMITVVCMLAAADNAEVQSIFLYYGEGTLISMFIAITAFFAEDELEVLEQEEQMLKTFRRDP